MTRYGYIRLRPDEEKSLIDTQKELLLEAGVPEGNILVEIKNYSDKLSVFENLESQLVDGDILYIPELRQAGRSLAGFLQLIARLEARNILVVILELPNSEDLNFQIKLAETFSTLSNKELSMRLRRQKRGLGKARNEGKLKTQKSPITASEVKKIFELKNANKTLQEISKIVGYSPATISRILNYQFNYPGLPEKEKMEVTTTTGESEPT